MKNFSDSKIELSSNEMEFIGKVLKQGIYSQLLRKHSSEPVIIMGYRKSDDNKETVESLENKGVLFQDNQFYLTRFEFPLI